MIAAWVVLSLGAIVLALQNLSVPGLYYDEAVFAGLARDFVTGQHRLHTPGFEILTILGRPFPLFVQFYLGALKSWLLIPALTVFGSKIAVLRLTSLSTALIALLFFMLGVRRWIGLRVALLAGALLAIDPTFFFLGVLDWGAAISGLLCRCLAFYLLVLWWQRRKLPYLFVAALFLGLGFFNKVDFAAFIIGAGIGLLLFCRRQVWNRICERWSVAPIFLFGLLLGAGPILFHLAHIVTFAASGQNSAGPNELSEKLNTLMAMYDGSYFYRLMQEGGVFSQMYLRPAGFHSLLPLFMILVIPALGGITILCRRQELRAISGFLLVGFGLTTIGLILIPGAVRIHHTVLAYPFPQLMIAASCTFLWEQPWRTPLVRLTRIVLCVAIVLLTGTQLLAIWKTEHLLAETGGRGRWSNAFDAFCYENRDRSDLIIISLDWGFNEQLAFLTNRPQLAEPIWALQTRQGSLPSLPARPDDIYLVHAPEYSLLQYDVSYLEDARARTDAEIQSYSDRQGRVVFYTIRFQQ